MTGDFLIGYTGDQVVVQPSCQIGVAYNESARPVKFKGKATIRSNTVIYGDVYKRQEPTPWLTVMFKLVIS